MPCSAFRCSNPLDPIVAFSVTVQLHFYGKPVMQEQSSFGRRAVPFLASDAASFITGQKISVNGF
jgi:NAD(P)-dependent dehydrogenase (short-subunit alcohol dehydrogenase family)